LTSQRKKEEKPTPIDGFTVDCYSLGFTGSEFGPDLHSFSIRKYVEIHDADDCVAAKCLPS